MSETQQLIKVTQEKLPGSQVGLEIEIPSERSRKAYDQVINKIMRTAQIPGFRKGKVPRQVVLKRFGATQLKASALEELIQTTLEAAIKQEKIEALGNLELRSPLDDLVDQYEPGEPLTFTASVDVPPDLTLKQYQDLQITAKESKYNSEQVDQALEDYRVARSHPSTSRRSASPRKMTKSSSICPESLPQGMRKRKSLTQPIDPLRAARSMILN